MIIVLNCQMKCWWLTSIKKYLAREITHQYIHHWLNGVLQCL